MHGLIAVINGFVVHHPAAALVVAFAAAVLEAVAIIGAVVPGTAVMMAVAGVAAAAGLPKPPFIMAAIAGAAVGDVFSYWIGHRFGFRLRGVWPLSRYARLLARADAFFARFGAPSVFIARFIPGLRATVPLVAGMAGMGIRQFLIADILSAAIWAPVHILPAQFAALALDRFRSGDWRATAAMVLGLLTLAVASYALHRWIRQRPDPAAAARPAQSAASGSRRDVAAR